MPEEKSEPIDQQELEHRLRAGVSLKGVEIGDVCFTGMFFDYTPDFTGAIFTGEANFNLAKFQNGAKFWEAEFIGNYGAVFVDTQFSGEDEVNFGGARFYGKGGANFSHAQFKGESGVSFWMSQFNCEGKILFVETEFRKNYSVNFQDIILTHPENLIFEDTWLGDASFFKTNLEGVVFKNVVFEKIGRWFWQRECLADEIREEYWYIEDEDEEKMLVEKKNYRAHVEILYRQLKRNFEEKSD